MGLAADLVAKLTPLPAKVAALCASAIKSLSATGVIIAGLAVAVTVQTIRLDGLHIVPKAGAFHFTLVDVRGWHPRALAAETALAQVKAAQPKAEAAQIAVNHQPAVLSAAIARETDAQMPDYLAHVAAVSAAHAVPAGGLCGAKAAGGVASNASVPGTDRTAQGHDDTAGSPDMVSVARADWDKLNREAALRVEVYQAGQAMIAEGVAAADADQKKDAATADQK